ncbi:hypothetical protein [Neobacillus niacini]|nr:hypothetical protein [Neobacillus niacini]
MKKRRILSTALALSLGLGLVHAAAATPTGKARHPPRRKPNEL